MKYTAVVLFGTALTVQGVMAAAAAQTTNTSRSPRDSAAHASNSRQNGDSEYLPPTIQEYEDMHGVNIPEPGIVDRIWNNANAIAKNALSERRFWDAHAAYANARVSVDFAVNHDPIRMRSLRRYGELCFNEASSGALSAMMQPGPAFSSRAIEDANQNAKATFSYIGDEKALAVANFQSLVVKAATQRVDVAYHNRHSSNTEFAGSVLEINWNFNTGDYEEGSQVYFLEKTYDAAKSKPSVFTAETLLDNLRVAHGTCEDSATRDKISCARNLAPKYKQVIDVVNSDLGSQHSLSSLLLMPLLIQYADILQYIGHPDEASKINSAIEDDLIRDLILYTGAPPRVIAKTTANTPNQNLSKGVSQSSGSATQLSRGMASGIP